MLAPIKVLRPFSLSYLVIVMSWLLILSSCVPSSSRPRVLESGSTAPTTPNSSAYPDPKFPLTGIFVQESSVQTTTQFSLPSNFTDSFLVRGSGLSQYLRTLPNTTKFCLVGNFKYIAGSNKFLIMSGKPRAFTDLVNKTTEFYLHVEPANDQANQNDCLTVNLNNSIFADATSPSPHYSLTQVCSQCSSAVTSEGLKLYRNNGDAVPNLNLSTLKLSILGSTVTAGNMCVESTSCKSRGFDCCLEGQCVTDGAIKPDAVLQTGFAQVQIDVASNPNRFILYPQFYFVCASRPEDAGSEDVIEPIDPAYDASIRLMELNQLQQCLNKVDGEFSYCTVKFTSASQKILTTPPTPFSSATPLGFTEDINFSNLNGNFSTLDYANNIVKIFYRGKTLYEAHKTPLDLLDGNFVSNTGNDDLTTAQAVLIKRVLPPNAIDDNLYLTFKIDGSCTKLGTSLARCSKSYVHGSTDYFKTTYHDASKIYKLPTYSDTSADANIIVRVAGVIIPEDITTWTRGTNTINFSASYPLYQNQTVDITYYVTTDVSKLTKAKEAAQAVVNTMCICGTTGGCNLNPIRDQAGLVVNYICTHPGTTTSTIPVNQTVFVSNKNVPHRFYAADGGSHDETYAGLIQENPAFSYASNNILKPSNVDTFTGFNEIYGSFTSTNTSGARPAKLLRVKKDVVYDLYANTGLFSTCLTCGTDYYNSLKKIFPANYTAIGGGYAPDNFDSLRTGTTGTYRSDDLLFGRACFVPATMIPWTHSTSSVVKTQRLSRLAGQHFLFANGYKRDWFGFDYGSLIGSFDGVTWFSIGNQRRIKATSSKLFIAVNAYHGDLNVDTQYDVTVSETTSFSANLPDHDTETTGAECQQSHFCSNDNDCFRQVGYEYTCQNISTITTNWPVSDANGTEIIGGTNKSLTSIIGGSNGQAKRCVYRGRGAPCHADLANLGTTFNSSSAPGMLTCSSNNMCQSLTTGNSNRFNDRIARYANTPVAQNSANATAGDIVGLGAKILGRPFDYYGTKTVPGTALPSQASNNLGAICIPGKNLTGSIRTFDLNSTSPVVRTDSSDKIFGIGPTMSGSMSPKYLNACPATDNVGVSIQQFDLVLGDPATINIVTTTQNMSTNLIDLPGIVSKNIFSSTNGSQITSIGYQRNACLRAPGASCFSDMDCAPSEFIASKFKTTTLTTILNAAEKKFWEEDLICGNPDFKYSAPGSLNTAGFNIKNNACCRDFGKNFTVYTQHNDLEHEWCGTPSTPGPEIIKVAGVNTPISSYNRYSRVHSAYDKMTCNPLEISSTKSFALSLKAPDAATRFKQTLAQYKTLDVVNQRTCCTKNWVRQFATTNGGGHTWARNKLQSIDKSKFRALNWGPSKIGTANATPYECTVDAYAQDTCEVRDFTSAQTDLYLNFFGALELVGIPQVALMSEDFVTKVNADDSLGSVAPPGTPPEETVRKIGSAAADGTVVTPDFSDLESKRLFSASNYKALEAKLKPVFAENDFNCCIPSNQQVPEGTTADQCCTGNIANQGENTTLRCCLPDYTDLTVYLNRYVSSEGRGLPDSAYDAKTGYIKDAAAVRMMATQKSLCCSGEMVEGVAIRRYPIPLTGGTIADQADGYTRRFVYLSNAVDNNTKIGPLGETFDIGIRWNNHMYCVPKGFKVEDEP